MLMYSKYTKKTNKGARYVCVRDPPKTVVIALGGNALLKDGESCTQEVQARNIKTAAKQIAKICAQREAYNVILTHGNGPQVGFLANQQGEQFQLDILNAETQGMIGMQLDNHLESELPGRDVTTLLTQVQVDLNDPAFKNPTKPIGPSYPEFRQDLAPMVQVQSTKKWRKVVASPLPKKVMELNAIKALVKGGYIVICCGGGGVPVAIKQDGTVVGVECVIDKDRTTALLAAELNADIFIMLTDASCLYKDWGKPTQAKVTNLDVTNLSKDDKAFIESLEAGSMKPKVLSGIAFAEHSTRGWAAIGAMEDLEAILAGTAGTRIQKGAVIRKDSAHILPAKMDDWNQEDVQFWFRNHIRLGPDRVKQLIDAGYNTGKKLRTLQDPFLNNIGCSWMTAAHIIEEIELNVLGLQRVFVESQPYRWPYNRLITPHNTAIIVIDMQKDFLEEGGYIHSMGYSLENGRSIIPALQELLRRGRELGFHIIHTREGHRPSLGDCPPVKHWRSLNSSSIGIGDKGPLGRILVKGEPGWEIIDELAPIYEKEIVIDKPGKGSFVATDLELILRNLEIHNLIITGVTTDVCVHTTLREANDRGFECLLVTDGCAALDKEVHNAAIKSVQLSGGIFGAVADTRALFNAFDQIKAGNASKKNE